MRKNVLLLMLIAAVKFASAQFCGMAGSNICSTNNTLTTFGISDYHTFPCVHDSVPYSEVIQVYVPDSIVQFGQHITISSVIIDSIIGLPCGLCWSCDNGSFTYNGGTRGCIQISGTTTDVQGAYEIGMYGKAVTNLGTFPGSFSIIGFQFFLNVVGQHDTCTPIDILDLHAPCAVLHVDSTCDHHPALTITPITTCPYTSATISVTNLTSPGYSFRWEALDSTYVNLRTDYMVSSFTVYESDREFTLYITDSANCTQTIFLWNSDGGPLAAPSICYTTTDSSQPTGVVKIMYERDNYFNTISAYQVFRTDSMSQMTQYLVGQSPGSVGYVIDTAPLSWGLNSYYIEAIPSCIDTNHGRHSYGGNQYTRSVLTVDTGAGAGYPYLYWTNSDPINYDMVYVYSRGSSGHWRLRYSSANINSTLWTDLAPDSTHVEYMLGYHINSQCDPSRSSVTAFSNFASADVTPDKVVTDTTNSGHLAVSAIHETHLAIYPNPANDKLNIQLPEAGQSDIDIYDMEGRLIMNKVLDGAINNQISVVSLAKGVYFLRWNRAGHEMAITRFLKK